MTTAAQRLAEAEQALHDFQLGRQAVEVRDSSGETVRFNATNVHRLVAYVEALRVEVAGRPKVQRPLRPIFG